VDQQPFAFFRRLFVFLAVALLLTACASAPRPEVPAPQPLPAWNDGPSRQAILDFVDAVTDPDGPGYVAPSERVAVFDNDGTLWSEKPLYTQMFFVLDQVKAMADQHPEWREQEPFRAVLEDDLEAQRSMDEAAVIQLILATHGGMTTAEYERAVGEWMAKARHPDTRRPFTAMVYQPMLELLAFLKANEFRVFIVSGGSIGFMRPWTESVYGIPPENVVGTSFELAFRESDGEFVIDREPSVHFINDKAGKPVGIERFIGRRPILAVGNSDGDFEMLQWTTSGEGPSLGMLVHHTDGEREWAYDRDSRQGRLIRGLEEAPDYGWVVIDMARDWNVVFGGE
jgi:phosphoglycolate phosphatase-like HAD superfamily hydrolase